jgi:hypothetical protein
VRIQAPLVTGDAGTSIRCDYGDFCAIVIARQRPGHGLCGSQRIIKPIGPSGSLDLDLDGRDQYDRKQEPTMMRHRFLLSWTASMPILDAVAVCKPPPFRNRSCQAYGAGFGEIRRCLFYSSGMPALRNPAK